MKFTVHETDQNPLFFHRRILNQKKNRYVILNTDTRMVCKFYLNFFFFRYGKYLT
jgi:hypothetical protein